MCLCASACHFQSEVKLLLKMEYNGTRDNVVIHRNSASINDQIKLLKFYHVHSVLTKSYELLEIFMLCMKSVH